MATQEQRYYEDVHAIRKNINRIANALEAIARSAPSKGLDIDETLKAMEKTIIHQNPEIQKVLGE